MTARTGFLSVLQQQEEKTNNLYYDRKYEELQRRNENINTEFVNSRQKSELPLPFELKPTLSAWLITLFYGLTDVWTLIVMIIVLSDVAGFDTSYIDPGPWAISVSTIYLFFSCCWTIILIVGGFRTGLKDIEKTPSATSYTSYMIITYVAFFTLWMTTIGVCFSTIYYWVNFGSDDLRAISDIPVSQSSRVWTFFALLAPFELSFIAFWIHFYATLKYWMLIWTLTDTRIYVSPFFPKKSVKFF